MSKIIAEWVRVRILVAGSVAVCKRNVNGYIPDVDQIFSPWGSITPSWTTWYASTFACGSNFVTIPTPTYHIPVFDQSQFRSSPSATSAFTMEIPVTMTLRTSSSSHFFPSAYRDNIVGEGGFLDPVLDL